MSDLQTVDSGDSRLYELGFVAACSSDGESQDLGETIGIGGGQMIMIGELPEGWGVKVYGQGDADTFFVAECDKEAGGRFADVLRGLVNKAVRRSLPAGSESAPSPDYRALLEEAGALLSEIKRKASDSDNVTFVAPGTLNQISATLSRIQEALGGK